MKYSIFIFWIFAQTTFGQTNVKIRIDPDNASGGTSSQIFDSIQFIPLETTKESLFGAIDQLEVTDSFFIILDKRSFSINFFRRNGDFVRKIKPDGKGHYFGSFAVMKDSNQIGVIDYMENALYFYGFDGSLKRKIKCPPNARSVFIFENGKILFNFRRINSDGSQADNPFDLGYCSNSGKIIRYLNSYDPRYQSEPYNISVNTINFSGEDGSCMYSLPLDYTVFQLNDSGIIKKFEFLFPMKYSLPPNFAADSSFKDKRPQYVYQDPANKEKFHSINSVYKIGTYLFFSADNTTLQVYAPRSYVYNLKNGHLVSFNRVTGDSASYFIPFLNTSLDKIDGVFGKNLFTSIPSVRILAIAKNTTQNVTYPKRLDELITTGTKMNNPVIVQFQIKENL